MDVFGTRTRTYYRGGGRRSCSPRVERVVHEVVCSRIGDVTFSRRNHQIMEGRVETID